MDCQSYDLAFVYAIRSRFDPFLNHSANRTAKWLSLSGGFWRHGGLRRRSRFSETTYDDRTSAFVPSPKNAEKAGAVGRAATYRLAMESTNVVLAPCAGRSPH